MIDSMWLRDILRLKRTPRTGWRLHGVPVVESVADHTFGAAMLAWRLAREVEGLDANKVVLMCLFHDFHESRLGDIPTPAKDYLGRERIKEAERDIAADQWQGDEETLAILEEFLEGETEEAKLARAIDHLELLIQADHHRAAGVSTVQPMFDRAMGGAAWEHPVTKPHVEELLARSPRVPE